MNSIYKIEINGLSYVGLTKRDPNIRLKEHIRAARRDKRDKSKLDKAILSGSPINIEILESGNIDLPEREKYWINYYNTLENGYNSTSGGEWVKDYKWTNKQKLEISKQRKGKKFTEEHKKNISKGKMGHITSEETKEKLRLSQLGLITSEETKEKMRASAKKACSLRKNKKKFNVFNKEGELIFTSNGDLPRKCEEYGIKYQALLNTYKKNNTLYESSMSKAKAITHSNIQFEGWYARIIK